MADTQWPAARVRKTFFDYFAEREHTVGEYKQL
jgi:alanyl-tRNA synthetase